MSESITARLARLQTQVAWWTDQAHQLKRDRRNLRWVVPVGALLAGAVCWIHALAALCLFGLSMVIWLMGLYMTTVRSAEFQTNLREAQSELREAQAIVQAQRDEATRD